MTVGDDAVAVMVHSKLYSQSFDPRHSIFQPRDYNFHISLDSTEKNCHFKKKMLIILMCKLCELSLVLGANNSPFNSSEQGGQGSRAHGCTQLTAEFL